MILFNTARLMPCSTKPPVLHKDRLDLFPVFREDKNSIKRKSRTRGVTSRLLSAVRDKPSSVCLSQNSDRVQECLNDVRNLSASFSR
jgi:hypothetical protein